VEADTEEEAREMAERGETSRRGTFKFDGVTNREITQALGPVKDLATRATYATCAESHLRLTVPASPPTTILKIPKALTMTPTRTMCLRT